MKIENARLKSVDLDNSEAFDRVSDYPYRHSHYYLRNPGPHPKVSITLELPPGSDQLLSHELLGRKVTVTFEPGPGEAAYTKDRERTGRALSWEHLAPSERLHWERVAEAAIKAAR